MSIPAPFPPYFFQNEIPCNLVLKIDSTFFFSDSMWEKETEDARKNLISLKERKKYL